MKQIKHMRIATRKSALALWQANWVKAALQQQHPELQIELVTFTTEGDRRLDVSLSKIGGKGLFVKELERALLGGEADIAVHSLKDMPMQQPQGLGLHAICQRHDPADVLLSLDHQLPGNARIGTSSFRRQCQLHALYPQANFIDLRGNINTRINKLSQGDYDAIVLAKAGVERLGLTEHVTKTFSCSDIIPAAGQGALAIECRDDDTDSRKLIQTLNHQHTRICTDAEREVVRHLQGDCKTPIAAYATLQQGTIDLYALVGMPDGSSVINTHVRGHQAEYLQLGRQAAEHLLADGAQVIIDKVKQYGQ